MLRLDPGDYPSRRNPMVARCALLDELELPVKMRAPADDPEEPGQLIRYIERLRGALPLPASIAVVGCGPRPSTIKCLSELGHEVVGVEPVAELAESARTWLGVQSCVIAGSAEAMPLDDESQDVVILESVLEHVESVSRSLAEAYRVCRPGGVLYVLTTNRLCLRNNEFAIPFYQWLPRLVHESIVFEHLHRNRRLANYTTRPAVHWFTYAKLCGLGRQAGFCRFYSKIDLVSPDDPAIGGSRARLAALEISRRSTLARTLALTQRPGGTCFMLKRPE